MGVKAIVEYHSTGLRRRPAPCLSEGVFSMLGRAAWTGLAG